MPDPLGDLASLGPVGFKCRLCNEFIGDVLSLRGKQIIDGFVEHLKNNHKPGDYIYLEKL